MHLLPIHGEVKFETLCIRIHFLETALDAADSRSVHVLLMTMVLLVLSESTQKYPSRSS